jgi:hypothetical protein
MRFLELATLSVPTGTLFGPSAETAAVMDAIAGFVDHADARGRLLGCWISELAQQNRILLLRDFETRDALESERRRVLMSSDPFGCGKILVSLSLESYAQFPFLPPVQPGEFGPVYEFRSYVLKTGGLAPTLAAWEAGLPARAEMSPLINAMYALDGVPRFIHIWAYRSLEQRTEIRAEAARRQLWPAKGALEWLSPDLKAEVYLPTSLSPLK